MPQLTATDAIKFIESRENVTTHVLAQAAKWTLEEVAGQAIAQWDTHMAAAAFQYLMRHGHTAQGARKILGLLTGTAPEEWERLIQEAESEGLLDVWI